MEMGLEGDGPHEGDGWCVVEGTHTVEDWTECARTHTHRHTKVKTVYPPVSLCSLGRYNKMVMKMVLMVQVIGGCFSEQRGSPVEQLQTTESRHRMWLLGQFFFRTCSLGTLVWRYRQLTENVTRSVVIKMWFLAMFEKKICIHTTLQVTFSAYYLKMPWIVIEWGSR